MKLTRKHFDYFKKRCDYWLERFHQSQWTVYYQFNPPEPDRNSHATASYNYVQRTATIFLWNEWADSDETRTKTGILDSLDNCACEEATHLIIAPLHILATVRYTNEEEVSATVEAITHTIVNAVR